MCKIGILQTENDSHMGIKDSYSKSWEKLIGNKESRTSVLSLFEPENYE